MKLRRGQFAIGATPLPMTLNSQDRQSKGRSSLGFGISTIRGSQSGTTDNQLVSTPTMLSNPERRSLVRRSGFTVNVS